MELPEDIRALFVEAGRKGGQKTGKKGFAAMDPKRRSKIQSMGGKAPKTPNIDSLYEIWAGIKARCLNPSNPNYKYYGGRGIAMFGGWVSNHRAFASWVKRNLGPRPSLKHSLDRIDNDGDYEPGNVRWATPLEQARNKRKSKSRKA